MKKIYFITILVVAIFGLGLLAGLGLGALTHQETVNTANVELDSLRANMQEAAVVKRVSQQMEDIAYQQKAISDEQRMKAEEQSKLALEMRDRAEQESKMAREAESKAVAAAAEAETQRQKALEHQKAAEEQRDKADLAKHLADTLNYRALGRNLGSSASTQYESNKELGRLLAYTSWYFLNRYKGNVYQNESFGALSLCTETRQNMRMQQQGGVRGICRLEDGGFVAVSDYGEIEVKGRESEVLLQNKTYTFVDVCADKEAVYALSLHGPLCKVSFTKALTPIALPEDTYMKVVKVGTDRLYVFGQHIVLQYSISKDAIVASVPLKKQLSAVLQRPDRFNLFFADASVEAMDIEKLSVVSCQLSVVNSPTVTAACYDAKNKGYYLGLSTGDILMFNDYDRYLITMPSHVSSITQLMVKDDLLISCSYDNTVRLWNLPMLMFESGYTLQEEMRSPVQMPTRPQDPKTVNTEWLTPVAFEYAGWPLALDILDEHHVAVGLSNGNIQVMNISAEDLAGQLKRSNKRSLTTEEWMLYVGQNVPYIKL